MAHRSRGDAGFEPIEDAARANGFQCIAGIDEAGRGPLAGPVVAAAVVLTPDCAIAELNDSKQLTARQRDRIYGRLLQQGVPYGIGLVSHAEIDRQDILWATKEAMCRAVQHLGEGMGNAVPDVLLIDGNATIPSAIDQRTLVRGDSRCASIAAASIVAKVTRDRVMLAYARRYPAYGFERHKGYPTRDHYHRLRTYGPCAIHRRSFRGVVVPEARVAGRG